MKSLRLLSHSASSTEPVVLCHKRSLIPQRRQTQMIEESLGYSLRIASKRWKIKLAVSSVVGLVIAGIFCFTGFPYSLNQNALAIANPAPKIANVTPLPGPGKNNSKQQFLDAFVQSPLSFEANDGQAEQRFGFLSKGRGYGIFLMPNEAMFLLQPQGVRLPIRTQNQIASTWGIGSSPAIVSMKLVGADSHSKGYGMSSLPGKSNYFIGNDSKQWRSNIAHYAQVRYEQVYPGIDLIYYGNQHQLEYDFVLAPGADPQQIKLRFEGVQKVRIADNGDLIVRNKEGEMRQPCPVVYQDDQGTKRLVASHYVLLGKKEVGIRVDEYDRTRPLTIDPVLVYSTFLGGSNDDIGNGIEADAAGNVYVTGITYSADFPVKNGHQGFLQGLGNAFVAKFNPNGGLIYNTFLGGSSEDVGFAITVDANGGTYIAGSTDSSNFPVTSNALQGQKRGRIDSFITKLNAAGDAILYSTFVGGAGDSIANSIAVDASGNAYVVGETTSASFPMQSAFQKILSGPSDAFVVKLNATGSSLGYATYLGGNGSETAFGIAVDSAGSAYVTGLTYSLNFPTKNPVQAALGGRVDAFVTKLTPAGNDLSYSTYLGGTEDDGGYGIGLDAAGNAYVSGFTSSTNFPIKNAFQPASGGGDDAVILKLDQTGKLVYSSYLGGTGDDRSFDLAVDKNGNAYLVGRTESSNFPVKDALQPKPGGQQLQAQPDLISSRTVRALPDHDLGKEQIYRDADRWKSAKPVENRNSIASAAAIAVVDGFVSKVDASGQLIYSTFLGGLDEDRVFAVAVDNAGNAYVSGLTASGDFPVKNNVQRTLAGVTDAFVAKISEAGNTQASVSAASYTRNQLAAEQIIASFGVDLAATTMVATTIPLPTDLAATTVKVIDSLGVERLAPLFFVSPGQINYQVPVGTAEGTARVLTNRSGVVVSNETVTIGKVAPGIFSANSNGQGVIAGLALRVRGVEQSYESVIQFDPVRGLNVPIPIDLGPESNQVYLVIFGTGFRNRNSLGAVTATIGGTPASVIYAGTQGQLVGLDQLNVLVPRSLAGRGDVDIVITIDGQIANTTKVNIK